MSEFWELLQPILITTLVSIVSALLLALKKWVESKITGDKYTRMSGIVLDGLLVALQRLSIKLPDMLKDGVLDKTEREALKNIAKQVIKERFSQLRGVALKDAMDWAEAQLDAELGKLEARLFGIAPQADGLTIGPDDEAQ